MPFEHTIRVGCGLWAPMGAANWSCDGVWEPIGASNWNCDGLRGPIGAFNCSWEGVWEPIGASNRSWEGVWEPIGASNWSWEGVRTGLRDGWGRWGLFLFNNRTMFHSDVHIYLSINGYRLIFASCRYLLANFKVINGTFVVHKALDILVGMSHSDTEVNSVCHVFADTSNFTFNVIDLSLKFCIS